jgi:hypothetical protein
MGLHSLTAEIEWNGTPQGTVSISFDRFDGERCQYSYVIRDHEGIELASGDDLRSGSGAEPNLSEMLAALLDFLGAAAESYPDGDNADMFPPAATQWAHYISDELTMAKVDLLGRELAGF